MIGVYRSNSPVPNYWRLMGFIDGENLVFCYQSMRNNGKTPKEENLFESDVYVWNENTLKGWQLEILRATYYTYVIGSEQLVENMAREIRNLRYKKDSKSTLPNNMTPCVFKKPKKSKKAKGVDIKMTVDILTNIYHDNLDIVFLVAGDGDYLPIIKEARRLGKQVYLAFFSEGLNDNLLNYVDRYINLDELYFKD